LHQVRSKLKDGKGKQNKSFESEQSNGLKMMSVIGERYLLLMKFAFGLKGTL
jgi:hypothetical protein